MNWYNNVKITSSSSPFIERLNKIKMKIKYANESEKTEIEKETVGDLKIWCLSEEIPKIAQDYIRGTSLSAEEKTLLTIARDEDGNISHETLMDLIRGIRPNREWEALTDEDKKKASDLYIQRSKILDPHRVWGEIEERAEIEGIAIERAKEWGLLKGQPRRLRKRYGKEIAGPYDPKIDRADYMALPAQRRQTQWASGDNKDIKTAGFEQSRIKRVKDKIRYTLKKKVSVSDDRRKELMKEMLTISTNWDVFGKGSRHYEENGYVAGANFDSKRGTYNYWLTENGNIEED